MENEKKVEKIDTSNIFEDFWDDSIVWEDLKKAEKAAKRDAIFYIKMIWNIFKYLNSILILALLLGWAYIWLQLNDNFKNKSYLNPVCSILLWTDLWYDEHNCSSLASLKDDYKNKLEIEKENKLEKIIPLINDLYIIEDFVNSKKVGFLIDKTNVRNAPLEIIEKFDAIKNTFSEIDKAQIRCSNINIEQNILEVDCIAYSSLWEKGIPWFNWEKTKKETLVGTSISIASSFINYMDISGVFKVEEAQKIFTLDPVIWEGNFTYKTDFSLRLVYKETNLLY